MFSNQKNIRGHIIELDGLRGIAILAVILHHFWPKTGYLTKFSSLAHLGWTGVDLFFVISGFLICGILIDTQKDPESLKNFYYRRIIRIFPLYYVFIFFVYFIYSRMIKVPSAIYTESGPITWYLFYLGNVREAITGNAPSYALAPVWSLSIEEQFYIFFPLILKYTPNKNIIKLLFSAIFTSLLFRAATTILFPSNERIQYLFTLSRIDILSLGCLLAYGSRGFIKLPEGRTTLILMSASILTFFTFFFLGFLDRTNIICRIIGYNIVGLTCFFIVLFVIQNRNQKITAPLRFRPLCNLGIICYGVYLLQRISENLLVAVTNKIIPSLNLDSALGMIIKCAFAILVAVISWYLFEKPILRLKKHFNSKNHPEYKNTTDKTAN